MKKVLAFVFALTFVLTLAGCKTDTTQTNCTHNWERIENLNEYTAVEKCSICNVTRMYTDPDAIPHFGTEAGFKMLRYNWDGYGIDQKEIYPCDLGYAIMDCLSKLQETGEIIPQISDDAVDELAGELPITRGTVWIECKSVGLFRLNPEMTEICEVQTHLGEGKALQMSDTLKELLRQAWHYHPNDCWYGTYENDTVTLQQVYKTDSAIEWVAVDRIHIENKHHSDNNKITLRIRANESKIVNIRLESYQSDDNLGSQDSKEIELIKDGETKVDLTFYGFYNCSYRVSIMVDNTRITLTIKSKSAN